MTHPHPTGPIELPPTFPVHWQHPDQEKLFWTYDRMHFPDAMTPLSASFMNVFNAGFNAGLAANSVPMEMHTMIANNYFYQAIMPKMLPPEEMEALGKQSEEKIGAIMADMMGYWERELLPEIKDFLDTCRRFDLQGATTPELLKHLNYAIERGVRMWTIHFTIAFPFLMAGSLFDEFYHDVFGTGDTFAAYKLLQGLNNKTIESGREQWVLSRKALQSPVVKKILEEEAAADVVPALEREDEGRAFLQDLRAYLDQYGQRGDKFLMMDETPWIEDPTPVIKNLKDFITQPDRDFDAERRVMAEEREQLIAEARNRLKSYPQAVAGQFEFLLKAAQDAAILSEDHGYWIDYSTTYEIRKIILEMGRRFAQAGIIEQPGDILFLSADEIRVIAQVMDQSHRDVRDLVAKRKAELAANRKLQPPPAMGTPPSGPPPDNAMMRAMGKFFGGPPQMPEVSAPNVLRGNAGSPGVVRGKARVIRSLAQADKLERGEILVAETTAPPWTPLFATAAAVVTDTGGILSHCAVVAREYHIPAVVGTTLATAMIRDGMTIEVDGNAGTVRLLDE